MFRNWGFLLGEIWVLLLLAALLGLLAGWLIWGRLQAALDSCRRDADRNAARLAEFEGAQGDLDGLRGEIAMRDERIADLEVRAANAADVDALRADLAHRDARIAELEAAASATGDLQGDAAAAARRIAGLEADLEACRAAQSEKDSRIAALVAAAGAAGAATGAGAAKASATVDPNAVDYDGDGVIEGVNEGVKPATLEAARNGVADDLKQIKGIGPQLEQLCNRMGFFHFDQVAAWTDQEVAWVDANLEGFKGRVTRDRWVEQARVLAAGGETEFSNRVKDGDVY